MRTFIELYKYLHKSNYKHIQEWFDEGVWEGKDKLESLLRLMAFTDSIEEFQGYLTCKGNFNLSTISPHSNMKEKFYYENNNLIFLNDKGDASDLTLIKNDDCKNIIVCTSKNLSTENINKLDISQIVNYYHEYYKNEGYTLTLCIVVKDIERFNVMLKNCDDTSSRMKEIIEKYNTIVLDINKLNNAYKKFIRTYSNINFDKLINLNIEFTTLKPYFHQEISAQQMCMLVQSGEKKILLGCNPRTGKTYVMAVFINKVHKTLHKEKINILHLFHF